MNLLTRSVLRPRYLALALSLSAVLAGCTSPQPHRAPVEDRGSSGTRPNPGAGTTTTASPNTSAPAVSGAPGSGNAGASDATQPPKPLPGAENAGKPGFYTVKPGDTLIRIALDNGQNWRDVARWSNLENANLIEVGQVLRVWPPGADSAAMTRPMTQPGRVETRPLEPPRAAAPGALPSSTASPALPTTLPPVTLPAVPPVVAPASAATPAAPPAQPGAPAGPREGDDDVNWGWPTAGGVTSPFDEARNNKGVMFAGKAGDPVLAAADGRVIYAGSGLRGYGNLVIVKHNATYLTAYAHNQVLLVKEDQPVRRGQRIAEMGSTDAERVQLHFEVRRLGKPVDPVRLLPAR